MVNIRLYSTGCPKCNVLKKKLDALNAQYVVITNEDEILKACKEVGTDMVPILAVEEPGEEEILMKFSFMDFKNAMKWVGEQINAD